MDRRATSVLSRQLALFVDLLRWSKQRHTPLWLEVAVDPGDALRSLEAEQPPRVFYDGTKGRPVIPLTLPSTWSSPPLSKRYFIKS